MNTSNENRQNDSQLLISNSQFAAGVFWGRYLLQIPAVL